MKAKNFVLLCRIIAGLTYYCVGMILVNSGTTTGHIFGMCNLLISAFILLGGFEWFLDKKLGKEWRNVKV